MVLTRRGIFRLLLLSAPVLQRLAAGSHDRFWNTTDPADWNEKEISEILTHSPWTRDALGESRAYLGPDTGMTGIEDGGGPRRGAGAGNGMPTAAVGPHLHVRVRWESAAPVSAALKQSMPAEAAQFYIIIMAGLPLRQRNADDNRRAGIEEAFKEVTSLQRKGTDPIPPERVELVDESGISYLRFFFPRDPNPITPDDKEVTFVTTYGKISIKARFTPKDMIYRDRLAV